MRTPVGLDLSLTSTGFVCGAVQVTVSSKHKGCERLRDIRDDILTLLQPIEKPIVFVEGYSFASRNSHAHALGELGGVVRLALWEQNIPFVEVAPTVRAKFATGRGNAGKGEVMSAVSARTGIVWAGSGADDKCDAWILEEIGWCLSGKPRFSWPKANTDALSKIVVTSLENDK